MKLTVAGRDGRVLVKSLEVSGGNVVTTDDLKEAFYAHSAEYTPSRQRWTFGNSLLAEGELLSYYKIQDGDTITFKDLGSQIDYQLVFLIEYLGPILIHPFFYFGYKYFYGSSFEYTRAQTIAFYCVMTHFIKRELETLFVHRFSHGTMPLMNVFKNSAHYWILSGFLMAGSIYAPQDNSKSLGQTWIALSVAVFMYGEISNFLTHVTLRNLRPPGSKDRKIPYGYGFDWVSCPNYFFETVAWVGLFLLTMNWTVIVFILVATGQMYVWAVKKHKGYRKDFPKYPRERKAMFPYLA